MEFETILTEERGNIFILTLNRPEARNAVNKKMVQEICTAMTAFEANPNLRVCIVTNTGGVFCAGSDLKEIAEGKYEMPPEWENWGFAGLTQHYFEKPIITAVQGKCLGGGVEIVMASDLCVASEDGIFGLPEPRVGLTAAGGGTLLRIAQMIPTKFAMELLLTAEPIPTTKAAEWGIINYAVPADQVMDKAIDLAEKICLGAPLAIQYSKKTAYETMDKSTVFPSDGWAILQKYQQITHNSEDSHEGSTAFCEKRKPVWTGR